MSQPEPLTTPPSPPPGGSGTGCALFAIGMLLLIPSGLCTTFGGFFLVQALIENPAQMMRDMGDLSGFIVITVIPLVLGIFLVRAGLKARRG